MKPPSLISLLLIPILYFSLIQDAYSSEAVCREAEACLDTAGICSTDILNYETDICGEPEGCLAEALNAYSDSRVEEALQKYLYISEESDDPRITGISSLMAGHIMGQLMMEGADAYLEKAHSVYPLIGDYALFRQAVISEERGEYEKATDLYMTVYRSYPEGILHKKALLKAADTYLASGETGEARELYENFISMYHGDESVPVALYSIGMSYLLEGEVSSAFEYFNRVWIDYPASSASWTARERINWLQQVGYEFPQPTPLDSFNRGEKLYEAGLYGDALSEYDRFLSGKAGNKSSAREKEIEAYYKTGMCNYKLRRSEEAEVDFETFLDNYPRHSRAPEALYWLGRTYLRQDKEEAFIKASKNYHKKYRNKQKSPEVLYRLAAVYAGREDIDTAISYYDRVIKEYPDSSFASDSLWAKGWLLYKKEGEKGLSKAMNTFNHIIQQKKSSTYTPQALYWKARVLERLGDQEGMEKSLCQLCNEYRGSYYCLFAMYNFNIACASAVDTGDTEVMGYRGGEIDEYRHGAILDERDIRIKLLLYLGLEDEALEMIQGLRHRITKDRGWALSLASTLSMMEEYNMSLKIVYSIYSRERLYHEQEFDERIWRLMYPRGYSKVVNRYARENNVDPYLLYALIREESWFNKRAVSSAGAIGLMQLMPYTAAAVNGSQVDRDSLFDPERNISLGTRYFSDLLKQFNGDIVLALASYNAGPNAVTRWLKEREGFSLDEFIEDIPYRETRNYVKKVFTSYMEYLRMITPLHVNSPPLTGDNQREGLLTYQ